MIPIRSFLIKGAKSEKTVESIRRNITVQGGNSITSASDASNESLCKGKRKEKEKLQRLRSLVRGQRKDLKARMLEVLREEVERIRKQCWKLMISKKQEYLLSITKGYKYMLLKREVEFRCLTRTLRGKLFIPLSADDVILTPERSMMNCLSSPPLLLQAIAAHTQRLKTLMLRGNDIYMLGLMEQGTRSYWFDPKLEYIDIKYALKGKTQNIP
ncbi:hypothetical protein IGI04_008207 [Brassica rapa subsp. trilocularis]|uniref:Uncharacterized protein n=1 Tax=Brassica rapa subsp. trilocularis TaxID=1813537 RepID=A0ABQ7NLZ1_BRACM|nr:hypothetical protein IGI04_008207 [Brassica rapa subsp. trilocularis]